MQTYWESLVDEFKNRNNPDAVFRYVPFEPTQEQVAAQSGSKSAKRKRIYLDGPYSDVYFTEREALCVAHAMRGLNIPEIGVVLAISGRTVEYYLKNVRKKMDCARLSHVIHALLEKTTFNPDDYL